jgi:hypothetical protein
MEILGVILRMTVRQVDNWCSGEYGDWKTCRYVRNQENLFSCYGLLYSRYFTGPFSSSISTYLALRAFQGVAVVVIPLSAKQVLDACPPNFLLALGLCCYTEYWGKLKLGFAQDESRDSFEAFLVELDKSYYDPIKSDIYKNVRCGLAHSYLIEGNSRIDIDNMGPHGIEIDRNLDTYAFYVQTYFEEFKRAVDKYIANLDSGKASVMLLEDALKNKPQLL